MVLDREIRWAISNPCVERVWRTHVELAQFCCGFLVSTELPQRGYEEPARWSVCWINSETTPRCLDSLLVVTF